MTPTSANTTWQMEQQSILQQVKGKTLADLLLRNAKEHGHRPALSHREGESWRTMSWREMREQVLDLAAGLADLGVGRGDYIGIMGGNRPEHVLGFLAAVHAGGTPSTFYSSLIPEQIHYVAENCGAKVAILENRSFMERWQEIRADLPRLEHIVLMEDAGAYADDKMVLSLEELARRGRGARKQFEQRWQELRPDDPATVIYTSGTTGPPKGVVLTHLNCLFEAEALDRLAHLESEITSVSYLPLAHIAEQLLTIYIPLQKASHVYCCPEVSQAMDFVRQARPFLFFGVPRVWEKVRAGITAKINATESPRRRRLAQSAVDTGLELVRRQQQERPVGLLLRIKHALLDRLVLAKIREAIGLDRCQFAVSAAAPLPVDVAEFFSALGLPLIEVYGMTETTGVCTGNLPGRIRIGTVGPALPGVEVTLASDGEVLTRAPNCTPGYLNRPEATAELIDDQGWMHTGDVGVWEAEGYIRIVDRKKELIITAGGKNISPANLENLLKGHPLVGQALAYGDRKPFVVALIVLDGEVAPAWARANEISFASLADLAQHHRIKEEVERAVGEANAKVSRVEQVKRFRILPTEWTATSEELTPTMKLKRRVIHEKYREEIEALYSQES